MHTTEYRSKRNPTVNPRLARPQTQHQAPAISSIDKSLSRSRHRVCGPTRRRAIKGESKVKV